MASIAFLGLGVMGFPMAGHLKNKGGHEIVSRAVLPPPQNIVFYS